MHEPEVIKGHPKIELEPEAQPAEPHWRPWGIKWKEPKPEPVVIYLCACCERVRTVLFLSNDRWLCTACRNEGTERPSFIPIGKPHG